MPPSRQSGGDRRQTRRASHEFASRQRRYRDALLCICREASIPTDVSIEDGSHAMKPIAMLLIGGSPPLLARGFRRALGARRAPVRTHRRLAPTIMAAGSRGPSAPLKRARARRTPAWAQIAAFSLVPVERRISSCTSVRALNLQMQTSFNTDCLPAESEHWRAQALEVRGGGSASQEIRAACSPARVRARTRRRRPGCAHAPGRSGMPR